MRALDSLLWTGLPSRWFTRTRAVATGLGIAAAVIGISKLVFHLTPDMDAAPPCYGTQNRGYTPRDLPLPPRGARGADGHLVGVRHDEAAIERVRLAEQRCIAGACPEEAWAAYRAAVNDYLFPRLGQTLRLDVNHGDRGLALAHDLYATPADRRIEQGLRERHAAGVFRLKELRTNQEAIAMIVLSGGPLGPCRAPPGRA